ncbi:class I SAM-dependent methyltransferase [Nitrospirota bacterium]
MIIKTIANKIISLHKEVMRSFRSQVDYSQFMDYSTHEKMRSKMAIDKYKEWDDAALIKPRPCPLCNNNELEKVLELHSPKRSYSKCVPCDFVFENPFVDEATYNQLYINSFDGTSIIDREFRKESKIDNETMSFYLPLELINKRVRKGKFLDFGCGTGWVMNLAKRNYGYDVYGLDIDKDCIDRASKLIGEPDKVFNGMDLTENELYGNFNIIHSNQNIEHLINPKIYLQKFYDYLDSDGLLFLSFPTSDSFVFNFLREDNGMTQVGHISMFSEKSIRSTLSEIGFVDIDYSHIWIDISAIELFKKIFGVRFSHRNVFIKSKIAIYLLYIPVTIITGLLHSLQHLNILKGNYAYVFAKKP